MSASSTQTVRAMMSGVGVRQVRLASGLVLFAYLLSHFLNHALGIVSLQALAEGVAVHTAFWQFLPVAVTFYTAAIVHTGLGIWALYQRRQFGWKSIEPLQLILGLSIPAITDIGLRASGRVNARHTMGCVSLIRNHIISKSSCG